jgi:ribosomal protein RSM22 (predicted rRNA methylase)
VDKLISLYRSGSPPKTPILHSANDVAAYAAYRMPATYAAVHSALGHFAELVPDFAPGSQVDIGGGTGTAAWAASAIWPSLRSTEILEQASPAITLGRQLASARENSPHRAKWTPFTITSTPTLPPADLLTLSYVLGELPEHLRGSLVREMAAVGQAVVIVEPGTPAGYQRILAARTQLIEAGLHIVAPCPHDNQCPIADQDWCHFSARINRTSLHRQLKSASLSHEDEKFSYVAATKTEIHASNRVVRHPLLRKGIVTLKLCTDTGELTSEIVSKRQGQGYREARDVDWGDAWPKPGEIPQRT